MRRAAIVVAALALAPSATAAPPPSIQVSATPASGGAPLQVTLTATGDAASYSWDLGDGTSAVGPSVVHTYGAGRFVARVTATAADGETSQAAVVVQSFALSLRAPKLVRYRAHLRFRGRLVPAIRGVRVRLYLGGNRIASGRTRRDGRFRIGARITKPGTYEVRFGGVVSNSVAVSVRPRISASLVGSGAVGHPFAIAARVRPATAGPLRIQVWRGSRKIADRTFAAAGTLRLATGRPTGYRVRASVAAHPGFAASARALAPIVYVPSLALGARGASVRLLETRLRALHYALAGTDALYGADTADAVVAFQKVHGLPRTGRMTAGVWRVLLRAGVPGARFPGDHIEVDKSRQVLFVVRDGRVILISHVSTGATGNTPVGRWHVYSKVPGWLPDGMFYSSFFVGAFAIHGYPSVPYYPASHGCVRLPVWLAPRIYALDPYGTEVDIYN